VRAEVEQVLGSTFDDKRLDALLNEKAWKTMQI
jgi:hypothetical protein